MDGDEIVGRRRMGWIRRGGWILWDGDEEVGVRLGWDGWDG